MKKRRERNECGGLSACSYGRTDQPWRSQRSIGMKQAVHGWLSTYERLVKSQNFFSSYLTQEDHSRLGRNRLIVGQLLEEEFDRLGIRYIAIMDNIDTAKGLSDIVPMQDLFNKWHAKNTSQKVRNVFKNKGMAGIPLTTNPPFGYMKNPETPKEWLIDEPAAKIVRQIFEMCVLGLGPTQIAKRLKSDKILTPTKYLNSIGRNCDNPPARQFNWCSDTVASILSKQEYCGDTVNFRSTTKSFKNKKKIERP